MINIFGIKIDDTNSRFDSQCLYLNTKYTLIDCSYNFGYVKRFVHEPSAKIFIPVVIMDYFFEYQGRYIILFIYDM